MGNENVPQIDYVGWSHNSMNLPIIKLYSYVDECIVHASCLSEVFWFKKELNRGGHGAIVALSTYPTGSLVSSPVPGLRGLADFTLPHVGQT